MDLQLLTVGRQSDIDGDVPTGSSAGDGWLANTTAARAARVLCAPSVLVAVQARATVDEIAVGRSVLEVPADELLVGPVRPFLVRRARRVAPVQAEQLARLAG